MGSPRSATGISSKPLTIEQTRRQMAFMNDHEERRRAADALGREEDKDTRPPCRSSLAAFEAREQEEQKVNDKAIAAIITKDVAEGPPPASNTSTKKDTMEQKTETQYTLTRLDKEILEAANKKESFSFFNKVPTVILQQYLLPFLSIEKDRNMMSTLSRVLKPQPRSGQSSPSQLFQIDLTQLSIGIEVYLKKAKPAFNQKEMGFLVGVLEANSRYASNIGEVIYILRANGIYNSENIRSIIENVQYLKGIISCLCIDTRNYVKQPFCYGQQFFSGLIKNASYSMLINTVLYHLGNVYPSLTSKENIQQIFDKAKYAKVILDTFKIRKEVSQETFNEAIKKIDNIKSQKIASALALNRFFKEFPFSILPCGNKHLIKGVIGFLPNEEFVSEPQSPLYQQK